MISACTLAFGGLLPLGIFAAVPAGGGTIGPMLNLRLRHGTELRDADAHRGLRSGQHEADAGSGPLNATQQVGGSVGPALLTTVFGTAGKDAAEKQIPGFPAEGTAQQTEPAQTQQLPAPWGHEVLTEGISTAFVPAAAMAVLALATAWFVIRVRKSDPEALSGSAGPDTDWEGNTTGPARRLVGRWLRTRRAKARPARPHQDEQNPEQRLHDHHHGPSPTPLPRDGPIRCVRPHASHSGCIDNGRTVTESSRRARRVLNPAPDRGGVRPRPQAAVRIQSGRGSTRSAHSAGGAPALSAATTPPTIAQVVSTSPPTCAVVQNARS